MIGNRSLSNLNRNILFAGILSGVAYMHEQGLMHRDLKPANIMIAGMEPPTPKITDFGSMSEARTRAYDKPGTVSYLAPEQVQGEEHGMMVDEWACAIMGIELVTRKETRSRVQTAFEIQNAHSILQYADPELTIMSMCCRKMLTKDTEERMAAEEAYNMLFYQGGGALKQALSYNGPTSGAGTKGSKRKRES
jgi:serine/threonine protein kinase